MAETRIVTNVTQAKPLSIALATPCKSGTGEAARIRALGGLHGRIRVASERALAAWFVRAICMDRLDYWAISKAVLADDDGQIDRGDSDGYRKAIKATRARVGRQAEHLLAKYGHLGSELEPGTWIHALMNPASNAVVPDWSQRLVGEASKVLRSMGELIQGAVVRDEGKVRREPLPPEDVIQNSRVVADYLEANNSTVPDEAVHRAKGDAEDMARQSRRVKLKRALVAVRGCLDDWDNASNDVVHLEVRPLVASALTDIKAAAIAAGVVLL